MVMTTITNWTLNPGDTIKRTVLHSQYGGGGQGGIAPSAKSKNVLIFSDPKAGAKHGYLMDGQKNDDLFHYTGEGQRGDQEFKFGNAAVLNHASDGRTLRLFNGVGGIVTYLGEYELGTPSHYFADAPETGNGPLRQVIVFRLQPKSALPTPSISPPPPIISTENPVVTSQEVEDHNCECYVVTPGKTPSEAERREGKLVQDFKKYYEKANSSNKVTRLRIKAPGEACPVVTDAYIETEKLLIEAKGSVERGAIRMAIGQLFDYSRFIAATRKAILVPSRPREDIINLLRGLEIEIIWRDGKGFTHLGVP